MTPFKFALYTLFVLLIGVCASYAVFDAMSAEQEAREGKIERQLSRCATGNFCKVEGYRFLTIEGRKE